MQSFLPLPQSAIGVFQKWICLKYASGAFAWYCAHEPFDELVHHRARLRVDRRLAEVDRLLGLHLRRRDPGEPLVGAVEVLRLRRHHPRVEPAGRALLRHEVLDRRLAACSVFVWYGHEAPITASPFLNRSISSEASAQYFLISGFCFLSRAIAASNWAEFSSYGSVIPSAGLRLHQVQRRVGDLDRVVGDGDLALVLRAVDRGPRRRRRLSPSSCCRAACSGPTAARCRSACPSTVLFGGDWNVLPKFLKSGIFDGSTACTSWP